MKTRRMFNKLVCCRGAVYVFGGVDKNDKFVKYVEKYCLLTKNWEIVSEMVDCGAFSACAFMDLLSKSENILYFICTKVFSFLKTFIKLILF